MQQRRLTLLIPGLLVAVAVACNEKAGEATPTSTLTRRRSAEVVADIAPPTAPAMAPARDAVGEEAMQSVAPTATPIPVRAQPVDATAMMIRTATASVEVRSLDSAVAAARQAAARHGGIVANATMETGREEIHRAVLQIKVPAARFDALLSGLAPLGRVESVAVSAQDVGEEYVDIEARLVNLRRLETRIIELLANRTGKLTDVLSVERELARIRGEIEQIEGRKRWIERSVALSTLELTLHEPEPIIAGAPGSNPIAEAFRQAWRTFVATVAWCIASLGVVVPVAILLLGLALVGRWLKRRAAEASS